MAQAPKFVYQSSTRKHDTPSFIQPSFKVSNELFFRSLVLPSLSNTSPFSPTANTTMDPQDTRSPPVKKRGPKPLQSSNRKTQYLILYNFASALLWLVVLGRVLLLVPLVGFGRLYPAVGTFVKWTQTMALLEVVHAALGSFFLSPSFYMRL